ncbi:glycosyltransferase family 117 protein [Maribellus maritimus]|uniref:glycosyltransferase family 117 protein n=1 Tax=Maribellus maritimus TaxID=2870838 RepID=UPI001EEC75DE|nr:DUF2723 domain-containing protein [Maribellus maritimus]MCG6188568.1 DUF2723 domain-containing protein [Maribellus maritimus]
MKFKSLFYISGIIVFILSFLTYYITLEPTTSFWDCSEFILSANKLEVNHPSGSPLFVLLGRIFTFLSFGNPQKIAWSINLMSGLFSAGTVFFLFQIIVFMAKKMNNNAFLVIGCGIIGSLTFAFTDSFWFSAVEGEVYALSMFFLSAGFWAALKWEAGFGEPENNRWLLFIAILVGLGLGVHLLNLLIIPSITMIVFLKSYKVSVKNILLSFVLGCFLLLSVLYILVPATMWFLSVSEIIFINNLHLPLNSGLIFAVLTWGVASALGIRFFQKKGSVNVSLAIFSVALVLSGFSVYAVNLIRSQAGPPVNFGEPDNVFSLIDYLNREQYPKRPLLYGENFNSPVIGVEERKTKDFDGQRYVERDLPSAYIYAPETCTFFPRMYSNSPGHEKAYKSWVNITGKKVRVQNRDGKSEVLTVPGLGEQLAFFVRFQVGHMFWRYFMWNFVGRQNDIKGRGEPTRGNWISGIKPIDQLRLGPQDNQPEWMRNNRARNTYFFIPFLLGILGAVFFFKKSKMMFYCALSLFLLAGLGLVVYINEIPLVPRERDYVFVGSFMVFSIWIGFGFMAIAEWLPEKLSSKITTVLLFIIVFLGSPTLLFSQNFNDHNRSNRYAARDFAANILNSCPENTILFTSGDNDTYPLLYCQEVEEIRPDVRIVVMPFVSANWFINQLKMQKNRSDGLKMNLPQKKIDEGKLDYVSVQHKIQEKVNFLEVLKFVSSDAEGTKLQTRNGDSLSFIPAAELYFNVSAQSKTGTIPVSLKNREVLYKHELAFWDIVVSNAISRPICFVSKLEAQNHGLLNYLHQDGLVYQLVPVENKVKSILDNPPANTGRLYTQLMNDFAWGNIDKPDVNIDYFTVYNAGVFQLQNAFNSLAKALLEEGEKEKACEVLNKSILLFPTQVFHHNSYSLQLTNLLFEAGLTEDGINYLKDFVYSVQENLSYYAQFEASQRDRLKTDIMTDMFYYQQLLHIIGQQKLDKEFPNAGKNFESLAMVFNKGL